MEVIGDDAKEKRYISYFFDNAGNAITYQVNMDKNIWTYTEILQRATFEFSADGEKMKTHWDWKKNANENWWPLCDLTVTKFV